MKSWEKVEIGSFLMERQQRFKPSEANFLGLSRIEKIDFSGIIHIANPKPTRTDIILVKKGDLVISGINAEKGAVSVYEGDEDVLATIHYSSYEVDKSKIDVEYFKWFLQSQSFFNILKEQAGGGIKTELKPKKLLPLKIYLPGIDTQREIAKGIKAVANEIKELKTINEKNQLLSTALRQSILQEAVQGKLVPQDRADEPATELLKSIKVEKLQLMREKKIKTEKPLPPISPDEIPYELPEGGMWVRLGEIQKIVEYGTSQKSSFNSSGIPILGMNNIKEGKIYYTSFKYVPKTIRDLPRLYLKKNDLLFNRTNSYELVGKTGIFKKEDDLVTFASYLIRVSLFQDFTDPDYINFFFNTPICRQTQIEPFITQQTGQANFNGTKLKNILIPMPPFNEQKRIVAKVDELMKLCDELEEQIRQSKEESERLMQAVLQEAFGGKDVEESNAEVSVA